MEEFKSFISPENCIKDKHLNEGISSDAFNTEAHQDFSVYAPEFSTNRQLIFSKPNEATKQEMLHWLAKEKEEDQKLMKKILESNFNNSKDMIQINCRIEKIENLIKEISNFQNFSKQENNKALDYLTLDPQEAVENLKTLLPNINCDHKVNSSTEINQDIEKIIGSIVEKKVENLVNQKFMKLKIQMKDQNSKLNLKEMAMSEKLDKIEKKLELIINENEKLCELLLNKNIEIENVLAQTNEYKIMFDKFMSEKFDKKTEKILILKKKLENYSSDWNSSLENLPKFKKMKSKILSKFNIEKSFMVQSQASHYAGFENYLAMYNEISDKLDKLIEDFFFDDKYIYGVNRCQNATSLWTYEIETHKKCLTSIITPIQLSHFTCIARLPNNELFCYGSWNPLSGVACIIDLKSQTLKRSLPNGIESIASGAIYYNNCVYVFGSSTDCNNALVLAKKFDLKENSWKDIAPLRVGAYYCSCVIFKGSILLSGYHHSNLYKYSIEANNYEEIFTKLLPSYKILAKIKQRVYIFQSTGVSYESEKGNEYLWNKISTGVFTDYRNIYITYNKGFIIMNCQYEDTMNRYKFSLKDKTFQEIID